MTMKEKLSECFELLQGLDIPPTLSNLEKLTQTLYNIRDVYNELSEGGEQDEAGPE